MLVGIAVSGSLSAGPIHTAIEKKDVSRVKKLLESKPGFVEQQDNMGYYPLHTAAKGGSAEIARILIDNGANVDQVAQVIDPGTIRMARRQLEMMEEVASKRDIPQEEVREAKRRLPIAREQREKNKAPMTPLQIAVMQENTNVAQVLLKNDADPNIARGDTYSPLFTAVIDENMRMVQLLVEKGADVNAKSGGMTMTPLYVASIFDKDMAVWLLDHGANPNVASQGEYPLHASSRNGHLDLTRKLIQNGAQVNVQDERGYTPLHSARSSDVAKLLINNGANVNATVEDSIPIKQDGKREYKQDTGITLLHLAAADGKVKAAKMLLDNGATPDAKTGSGLTPLEVAKKNDHDKIVKMLKNA